MGDLKRLRDGDLLIHLMSPSDSMTTLSVSPTEKLISHNPQSLYAKPWPARPQRLHKGVEGWRWWDSAVDSIMLMIPIPFFILAAAVVAVNGKVVDERELNILDQSIKGGTTLFPICFAAITGRAAIKFATWKLEQGTTIGVLEQLMGSRTVASALTTQLQLRSFNFIGLGMIMVWSLSPIGGQSILHILYTPIQANSAASQVSYVNSRQQSYSEPPTHGKHDFQTQWFNPLAIEMGSMMIAPATVKESTMDVWGNVKIPFQSSVADSGISSDREGWVDISSLNATANGSLMWSSLFGIPVTGINFGNTTFRVESTHMELSCTNKTSESMEGPDGLSGDPLAATFISTNGPYLVGYKGLDVTSIKYPEENAYILPQSCPDCLSPELANQTFQAGSFAFQEFEGTDPGNATTVFCTPLQQYIESQVFCMKTKSIQQCHVRAQRPSRLPHMPSEVTYLSFPAVALGLSALLPNITVQTDQTNEIQNYIDYDPLNAVSIVNNINTELSDGPTGRKFLSDVDLVDIQNRLGQILNAFIYGSTWNASAYITGATFGSMTGNFIGGNNASFIPATKADLVAMIQNQTAAFTVPAVLTKQARVYLCFFLWLGVYLFSTLVMLLAAITGVVFSRKTIVPDYLGFVSSLAKESPWIRMPDVGVNMDGIDKARLVKEVKVRLGDVSYVTPGMGSKSDIGRLAFARLEETTKVKRGKFYV